MKPSAADTIGLGIFAGIILAAFVIGLCAGAACIDRGLQGRWVLNKKTGEAAIVLEEIQPTGMPWLYRQFRVRTRSGPNTQWDLTECDIGAKR